MRTHLATVPARNPFHFPIPIYYTTRTVPHETPSVEAPPTLAPTLLLYAGEKTLSLLVTGDSVYGIVWL